MVRINVVTEKNSGFRFSYSFFETFTIFMLLPEVFSAFALNSVFRASLTAFAQIWENRM